MPVVNYTIELYANSDSGNRYFPDVIKIIKATDSNDALDKAIDALIDYREKLIDYRENLKKWGRY